MTAESTMAHWAQEKARSFLLDSFGRPDVTDYRVAKLAVLLLDTRLDELRAVAMAYDRAASEEEMRGKLQRMTQELERAMESVRWK